MASQFQNRLVGISILVACVVLFLPTIIDGKKTAYEDEFIATPIHPDIKQHTQVIEMQPEIIQQVAVSSEIEPAREATPTDEKWQVEEVASTVTIEKNQINTTLSETPQASEKVITSAVKKQTVAEIKKSIVPDNAWTIQLGAFQNAANINTLLKTLNKAGYQAHTVPKDVIDGELTRVFVGPDISKVKLEKQLARLKQLTELDGKLYPFDAVNP